MQGRASKLKLANQDIVYITGEIQYNRIENGGSFVSVPSILANKILRMENDNKADDLEQLKKGVLNVNNKFNFISKNKLYTIVYICRECE